MKNITTMVLTLALSAGASVAQSAGQAELDLAECMAELQEIYGEDTELTLVDRRRNQHGTRMRVAAKLDDDNAYFANCWVARYDTGDLDYLQDESALAATESVLGAP